jgi:hypothetical protein
MNKDILGALSGSLVKDDLPFDQVSPFSSVLTPHLITAGDWTGIKTDQDMTAYLDKLLALAIDGYDSSFPEIDVPIGSNHKWRYSSAYQKAVRRNDPSIKLAAAAINACDPAYIWKRAPVIALEDISIGDPWVCAVVLHACRFAASRKKYGADHLAAFLGTLMGSAIKDRLSCDGFCLPIFHPALKTAVQTVDRMSVQDRADLYCSDDTPMGWRMCAGFSLSGPRYGYDVFAGTGGHQETFFDAAAGMAPYLIMWVSRQYAKMAREAMFVSFPLVWRQIMDDNDSAKVAPGHVPPRVMIDGVLSAAFDGHTQDGKRALAYFAKASDPMREFFAKYPTIDSKKVLPLALFTADSSLLDRYVSTQWALDLYAENLRGEALKADIKMELLAEVVEIIDVHRPALDKSRRRVTEA